MLRVKVATVLSLATLFAPALAQQGTNQARPENARPGTINYVEGQAAINGREISRPQVGSSAVGSGQILATGNGKAEMLLTPGVYLRLGSNSVLKMVSPDLTKTEVELERGNAEVEVDQVLKGNDLQLDLPNGQGGAQVALVDRGLYELDANAKELRVFDGKAAVSEGSDSAKWITVKGGHEIALTGGAFKSASFSKRDAEAGDDLYRWSGVRSEELAQANQSFGPEYAGGPGWAWNPAFYGYTWFPYDGLFYSPFGFGFYSPAFYGGYGFGYRPYGFHGGYVGGFHGGSAGFAGGGFHGGGGGRR